MARPRREAGSAKTDEQKAAEQAAEDARKEVEAREKDAPGPEDKVPAGGDATSSQDGPAKDGSARLGPPVVEEDERIKNAPQMVGADAQQSHRDYEAQAEGLQAEKAEVPSGHVMARVKFTSIGYHPESKVEGQRERVQYADEGQEVPLTQDEFDRLEKLGAVEKAD